MRSRTKVLRGLLKGLSTAADVRLLFTLRPFDTATAVGRSKERYRRVAISSISGLSARVTSILAQFISVPLALSYLGPERYGVWLTLTSLMAIISLADLGLGNGLMNVISETEGTGDRRLAREAVSSAFFSLTGLAAMAAVIIFLIHPGIPWAKIFNVHSARAVAESSPTVAVFFVCLLLGIPLNVALRVHMGVQETYVSNLWMAAGSLFGLAGLAIVVNAGMSLPWLVLSLAGGPVLASGLSSVYLFWKRRPWLRPGLGNVSVRATKQIMRFGMLFFVLQLAGAVGYQSDNLIIARILGADQVPQYGVPLKLFTLAPVALSLFLMPLWPAYREALSRGDYQWVRRALPRSFALAGVLVVPASIALMFFAVPILRVWVGTTITPNSELLVALGLWAICMSLSGPLAMYLNAAGIIRFQVVCASMMALANIILSIILVRRIGVAGAVYGSVVAQLVFALLPCFFYVARHVRSLENCQETKSSLTADGPT